MADVAGTDRDTQAVLDELLGGTNVIVAEARLIVVIDDAHALDESAIGLIGRARHDDHMTVLLIAAEAVAGPATDAGAGDLPTAVDSGDDSLADDLTHRENEVAQLVSQGLSNKEIAQRLFLSVRTVESHVYTARGKTGAESRRELGRLVADSGRSR